VLILSLFACNILGDSNSDQDQISPQASETSPSQVPEDREPTRLPPTREPEAPATERPPSASALRIVYTDGGDIWMIEGTGAPQQITSSGFAESVLISPDGMKIVFTRRTSPDDLAELRVVNADGTGEIVLLSVDDMKALYPSTLESKGFEISQMAFLPGSHALYFNTYEAFETVGLAMTDDLLRMNTHTGELTRLLTPGKGGNFFISPDGNHIVIVRPDSISMVGPGGGGLVPDIVTYLPVITYSEFQYYAQPVWAMDFSAVGVAIPNDDPLGPNPRGFIWRMNNSGSSSSMTGTVMGDFYFSQVFSSPVMSPTLNRMAFLRDTATTNIRDLFLANPDGTGETLHETGDIGWVGWVPDGIHFVYSLGDPMNLQLGTDGAGSIPLTTGRDLRWINANKFLCLSGSIGAWTLMIGEPGVAPIPLVSPSGDFISYDFTR
jgi:hypothetical protein